MDNSTSYRACEYDLKVRQTIPFYETFHSQVIRLVNVVKPDVTCWVDTGCGTGHLVQQARPVFPDTRFVLADPSEAMLAQARGRLAGTPENGLTFLPPCGSAELGRHLAPAAADVITAVQCHHYLKEPARLEALQTCFHTLRPGGLLVSFENAAPRTAEGARVGLQGWKSFMVAHGRTTEEADKHLARYGTEFFPITVEQHLQLLTQAGFSVVELFWYSHLQAGFYAIK